jgi:hypothetical protein
MDKDRDADDVPAVKDWTRVGSGGGRKQHFQKVIFARFMIFLPYQASYLKSRSRVCESLKTAVRKICPVFMTRKGDAFVVYFFYENSPCCQI